MIDILALMTAVAGLEGVVKAGSGLVGSIKGKWNSGDDEVKQQLTDELERLRQGVDGVADLAEAANAYVETRDEVHRLLFDCEMLERAVRENLDALKNHLAPGYQPGWATVDQMVAMMEQDMETVRKVHLRRQEWYDQADDQMVSSRLADVGTAKASCVAYAKSKNAGLLMDAVDDMRKPLTETSTLLKQTLQDKILRGLTQVRG